MTVQNRRDQVLAYRFVARRRHASLLAGDPDSVEAPLRKLGAAALGSVMIATLAVAAAGVAGVISPSGSKAWKDGKSIIYEKDTGSRFIYEGGQLRHVLNYTSARLLLAQSGWKSVSASASSLAGVPRGLDVGIAGAPDELPDTHGVVGLPWSVCSLPAASADSRPYTEVGIGAQPAVLKPGDLLGADRALLARLPDGSLWLIWHNRRLHVRSGARDPSGERALADLFGVAPTATDVTTAWLDTVAAGPDLATPPPSAGTVGGLGPTVGGHPTHIGQVVRVQAPGQPDQWYMADAKGLTRITQVQAVMAENSFAAAATVVTIAPADLAGVAVSTPQADPRLPATAPTLFDGTATGSVAACTAFTDPAGVAPGTVTLSPLTLSALRKVPASTPPPQEKPGTALADYTDIAPGKCAIVRELPADGSTTGALFLVTGYGDYAVKYPVPDQATLDALGFKGVAPLPVPPSLVDMVRTGMTLDTADARDGVPPASGVSTAASAPQSSSS